MLSAKDLFFTPAATGAYTINNSLRFRSSASAYLSRTFGTPTNNKIFTWSAWVKIGTIPTAREALIVASNGTNYYGFEFNASAQLNIYDSNVGGSNIALTTNQVFRDCSSWYHIVMAVDTTQSTASNRNKLYVNGVQITSFAAAIYSPLNSSPFMNTAVSHSIGSWQPTAGLYFDGYLAETYFIDGQALTPSSFGQTDATTGVWQPKAYTGTYGTNGFYLKFADASAATAAAIGKDSSGNGNNWTPSGGISVSAGVTYDAMIDSPTNSAAASNYAVLNPLDKNTDVTLTNGNLTYSMAANASGYPTSSVYMKTGKWYWEVTTSSLYSIIGVTPSTSSVTANLFTANGGYGYYQSGNKYVNGAATAYGATFTTGDNIGVALDLDSGTQTITFYKNGVSQGAINIGTSGLTWKICSGNGSSASVATGDFNFGQRPFTYTPPSGFVALNTQNLPTPTIAAGANYMAAVLYNGTSASNTVTATSSNSGNNPLAITFQPDLVWIKSRSAATNHEWTDSVRGVTKSLNSNTTAAEATDTNGLTAFTSSGFTVGSDSNYNNGTGPATYVAWEWKAGGTSGTISPAGTIAATGSANVSAGFSVVTWTGTGANATIGHGLGVAPSLIIAKGRNVASDWAVYHASVGNGSFLYLDATAAAAAGSMWNSTSPTSTVFSAGSPLNGAYNWLAYCFAPVAGYSAFGSYTGNGSADGPFVFTGFRPRLIMVKRTDTTADWVIVDTTRNTYNLVTQELYPDLSNAESASTNFDILSNGFKLRGFAGYVGASGGTYIYAAFAENPLKYSLAR